MTLLLAQLIQASSVSAIAPPRMIASITTSASTFTAAGGLQGDVGAGGHETNPQVTVTGVNPVETVTLTGLGHLYRTPTVLASCDASTVLGATRQPVLGVRLSQPARRHRSGRDDVGQGGHRRHAPLVGAE